MYDIYLKKIKIEKVRHLHDIEIPLGENRRTHLILTGKNGSGKTSLLEALSHQLDFLARDDFDRLQSDIDAWKKRILRKKDTYTENMISQDEHFLLQAEQELESAKAGLTLEFNVADNGIHSHFEKGEFVLAYYQATRKFQAELPKHVEKVELKDHYAISESPRNEFIKYLLDLKVTEAIAKTSGKEERAKRIHEWFDNFERLLVKIFEDDSVHLHFDEDTFAFTIHQKGREPFDFQELSDGYAAVLDIVVDLLVRMVKHLNGGITFDMPGIVLIDEIETHLHLELQKKVMNLLISVFPNIQFIGSTHSPFILSNIDHAVIYDLEKKDFKIRR